MEKQRLVKAPKFNYTLILAIIRLGFALSGQPLIERQFFYLIEQLETNNFNNRVNLIFPKRKKYLMINLRIPEVVKFPSIPESFDLIYTGDRWNMSRCQQRGGHISGRIIKFNQGKLDLSQLALQWVNKACEEIGLGQHLTCLAVNLSKKAVNYDVMIPFLYKDPKILSISVCLFLLKLFYSVGLDSPSIVNTKKEEIKKYVTNDQIRKKLIKAIDFIDEKKKSNKAFILTNFSRKIPSFQSMVDRWMEYYDFWDSRMSCVSSFTEIGRMGLDQLENYIEKKLKVQLQEKCDFQDNNIEEFVCDDKPLERVYSLRKIPNLSISTNLLQQYNITEDQKLREEIAEEIEFIEKNKNSKKIEIPHPSDIFVKYKQISSCPVDKLGTDYLILIEFMSFYFEMKKEKIIQTTQKLEDVILDIVKKNY